MAVDTPARIAVLGAGPVGLEAALYARFLGYDVDVFERGRVAENLLRWGHVRLFSPFRMNASSLGLAALHTQDSAWRAPARDALLTGRELAEAYLIPLSQSDLLDGSIHEQTEVLAVGRSGPLKGELIGDEARADYPFRLLLRNAAGVERMAEADLVIDATGTYGHHQWLGQGGIPAIGEQAATAQIEYGLPDVLGQQREQYAQRHVLVVGGGYSAASTIVALAELAKESAETRITWITRRPSEASGQGPIPVIHDDPLTERDRLARAANQLALADASPVTHWAATTMVSAEWQAEQRCFQVRLAGERSDAITVDRIVANVGYRPDRRLYEQLQVHECYATEGPMKLAAARLGQLSADCLSQKSCGPESLLNPEPNFYILGAKSFGRDSRFLISAGLEQIRDVFSIIGDRQNLNLYATVGNLG